MNIRFTSAKPSLVEGDTAAAHGNAVESCSEEPDVVLEELVHRERVALLRQVGPAESPIQLGEELPNLLGRGRYPLDRHLHLRSVRLIRQRWAVRRLTVTGARSG